MIALTNIQIISISPALTEARVTSVFPRVLLYNNICDESINGLPQEIDIKPQKQLPILFIVAHCIAQSVCVYNYGDIVRKFIYEIQ